MNHRDIREACCEANRRLSAIGLVDLTFGNVSVIDRAAGVLAIKPSGVDYADLTPEIVIGWVQDKLDVPAMEAALQTQLDEQAAPTKTAGVPWA